MQPDSITGTRVRLLVRHFSTPSAGKTVSFWGMRCRFGPHGDCSFVDGEGAGSFRIHFKNKTIEWKRPPGDLSGWAKIFFRGRVLGLVLSHLPNFVVLHANVIARSTQAIFLLGPAGCGKSTLTASFLNAGFSLLSDDLAVVRLVDDSLVVEPGIPEIRLWPQSLVLKPADIRDERLYSGITKRRLFLSDDGPWRFGENPLPPGGLYLLSRKRRGKIRIETVHGKEKLMGILQNVYTPLIQDAAVLENQFEMVARLVKAIPVRRVIYPSGIDCLDAVRRALLDDSTPS